MVCVGFVHLFVYFACVNFCPFSLPLSGRDWLRFVTVAFPGLFYYVSRRFDLIQGRINIPLALFSRDLI